MLLHIVWVIFHIDKSFGWFFFHRYLFLTSVYSYVGVVIHCIYELLGLDDHIGVFFFFWYIFIVLVHVVGNTLLCPNCSGELAFFFLGVDAISFVAFNHHIVYIWLLINCFFMLTSIHFFSCCKHLGCLDVWAFACGWHGYLGKMDSYPSVKLFGLVFGKGFQKGVDAERFFRVFHTIL